MGGQQWRCSICRRRFTLRSTRAFCGRAFPDASIAVAVRRYVRFRLSLADVAEWPAERGNTVDRSTVHCWVQRYVPLFAAAVQASRKPVGTSWRVEGTYLRLSGHWVHAYRAIDHGGQVIDFYVSARRTMAAARTFFECTIPETTVRPDRVTTDQGAIRRLWTRSS